MNGEIRVVRQAGLAWQCPFSVREIRAVLMAMSRACGLEHTAIDLTMTDDAGISSVNAERLGCVGPTNILSFPSGSANGGASLLLSLDTLERECFLYGQDPEEHTLRLLAHGMAHLAGLDHGPDLDAAQEAAMVAGRGIAESFL